jgi:hypothetical protein
MIPLQLEDLVTIKVAGTYTDKAGTSQPFTFSATLDRLDIDAIQSAESDTGAVKISGFFAEHVKGWSGVKQADGKTDVEYSVEALQTLLRIPGLPHMMWLDYLQQVGVKGAREKN